MTNLWQINSDAEARLWQELGLQLPVQAMLVEWLPPAERARYEPSSSGQLHQIKVATNVRCYCGHCVNGPVENQDELIRSMLHEARHAQQHERWGMFKAQVLYALFDGQTGYKYNPFEVDADEFADAAMSRYKDLIERRSND